MNIISEQAYSLPAILTAIQEGKTIVYPTETCYGLGCDATNAAAVQQVFAIKQRQKEKSVLMLMEDIAMATDYVMWNDTLQKFARRYWPGPVTFVAYKREDVWLPEGVIGADDTLAFRVSSHGVPTAIVSALKRPLVSTSANIASHASPYDVETIIHDFQDQTAQPDIIIDAGALPEQMPSTIVRVEESGEWEIMRQGSVIITE